MNIKNIIEKIRLLIDPNAQFTTIANLGIMDLNPENDITGSSIILSIANIEEDSILKNATIYEKVNDQNQYRNIQHPNKHLLISLLFSAYSTSATHYLESLVKLQQVIQFFQDNRILYYSTTDQQASLLRISEYQLIAPADNYLPIQIDAISLSFDQLNQMWSYIGTKYMPSVLYKIRFIPIATTNTSTAGIIETVRIEQWKKEDPAPQNPLSSNEYTKEK